jgi:hypothetical protein
MAKKNRKRRRAGKARTKLSVTPISKHQKLGKELVPPLAQLKQYPGFAPRDWASERLPEMLWASMLIASFGRREALDRFRALGRFIQDRCHADETRRRTLCKVTLSGLSEWNNEEFEQFVLAVVRDDAKIFSAFTLFDELPGVERWRRLIPEGQISLDILKTAVGITLWHQSQEATDCRWMRVLGIILSGSMHFPPEMKEEVLEILEYPNLGEQREVRPRIRSLEGSADASYDGYTISTWSPIFWQRAFDLTRDGYGDPQW